MVINRIVVSFTTTPCRIDSLGDTLDSISRQTLTPNDIYLNVPYVFGRDGTDYQIPDWLADYPNVSVNRCEDYGPITKLFGALLVEDDPDTIIVTIDDDIVYGPRMLENYVAFIQRDRNSAYGAAGISVDEQNNLWLECGHLMECEILEGWGGIAYRRGFFDETVYRVSEYPSFCRFSDDLVLSNYLSGRNIRRRVVFNSAWSRRDLRTLTIGLKDDALHRLDAGGNVGRYVQARDYLRSKQEYYL